MGLRLINLGRRVQALRDGSNVVPNNSAEFEVSDVVFDFKR